MKIIQIIFLFFIMPSFAQATLKTRPPQYSAGLAWGKKTISDEEIVRTKKQIRIAKFMTFLGATMMALPFALPIAAIPYALAVGLIYLGAIPLGAGAATWVGMKYWLRKQAH